MSSFTKKEFELKRDELLGKTLDFMGRSTKKSPFGLTLISLGIDPNSGKAITMKQNIKRLLEKAYEMGLVNSANIVEFYELFVEDQLNRFKYRQVKTWHNVGEMEILVLSANKVINDRKIEENSEPLQNSSNEKVLNYCPNCGYKIDNPVNFCPSCGFKF